MYSKLGHDVARGLGPEKHKPVQRRSLKYGPASFGAAGGWAVGCAVGCSVVCAVAANLKRLCRMVWRAAVAAVPTVMLFAAVSSGVHAASNITGMRFGSQNGATRIVLDLDASAEPRVFLLENPYRVVLDFDDMAWVADKDTKALGVVSGYRHGLFDRDTYRIVLDLDGPAEVKRSFALKPNKKYGHRFVLDLAKTSRTGFASAVQSTKVSRPSAAYASSNAPEPAETAPERTRDKNYKPLIVLDAGHGGPDPGTLGVLGVNEKIITLQVAQRIAKQLEATGRYRVQLTRNKDFFIPVRDRFKIARGWGADLFISIHADAIDNKTVRGGTVYTLSETASDRESARLAARENKSDLIAGVNLEETDADVSSILIELAQRETMNVSAGFAEILVQELRGEILMHKRGHRFANLGMLKAPDIPSVLIETGYLSNKDDAAFLASGNGQKKIATAVQKGVDRFFEQRLAFGG